jgi:uncharacterized sulfatase
MSSICLDGTKAIAAAAGKQSRRPNVIAIVTDDQSDWGMGAYGNRDIHTPNMDRIANEGMLFTNSFVNTPVCSPSRATYLSGLYPTQHTIIDFLDENEAFDKNSFESLTWPAVLQKHGYKTALVGKWDLGVLPRYFPTHYGFDHYFGWLSDPPENINPKFRVNNDFVETPVSLKGGGDSFPRSCGYFRDNDADGKIQQFEGPLPDVLTNNALAFLKANMDNPFALLLHYDAPHNPFLPVSKQDMAHYKDIDPAVPEFKDADVETIKRLTKEHYASVSSADRNIGRVLDFLERHDLTNDTLVIFTSDNGYCIGHHHIIGKGNGQWTACGVRGPIVSNMWEKSMRVPLAIRWPGVIKPGSRADHMITTLDMFRTILGMLNVPMPKNRSILGTDFSPLLRGGTMKKPDAIFGQYDAHNKQLCNMRMIRTERWKYIHHFRTNFMHELYDLKNDPEERESILNRDGPEPGTIDPATFQQLKDRLFECMRSIDDPLLKAPY